MHPVAETDNFVGLLGLQLDEVSPDRVTAHLEVRPELHQPFGILHGGVHCSIVETLASVAAAVWLGQDGHVVGVANQTDFLRAVRTGVPACRGPAGPAGPDPAVVDGADLGRRRSVGREGAGQVAERPLDRGLGPTCLTVNSTGSRRRPPSHSVVIVREWNL